MPSQKENVLNQILYALVHESPFYEALQKTVRPSPVLSLDEYTQLLFAHGSRDVLIYQKVYPLIAGSADTLYDFISGSALVPFLEILTGPLRSTFIETFRKRIADHFPSAPIVYAFKRIIIVGKF